MSDFLDKLVILFIGWLLGLLGPAIVDAIRRERENKLGRTAILSELRHVGSVLAIATYAVRSKEGTVDRAHLEWLKSHLEGAEQTESNIGLIQRASAFLEGSDEEIVERFKYMASPDGKSGMLQKYPVPLLDSRVSALWSFDTDFQRRLLDIKLRMSRLDDMVERQRKLHDLTFTNLDDSNRKAVQENTRENALFYAQNAKLVADLIARLGKK